MAKRRLVQIAGWLQPQRGRTLKERMRALREIDPRYSESRIVDEEIGRAHV